MINTVLSRSGSADEAAQKFIIAEVVATWAEKSIVFHLRTRDIDHSREICAPYVMISYDGLCKWWMLHLHSHCNRFINNTGWWEMPEDPSRSRVPQKNPLLHGWRSSDLDLTASAEKILGKPFLPLRKEEPVSAESKSFDLQFEAGTLRRSRPAEGTTLCSVGSWSQETQSNKLLLPKIPLGEILVSSQHTRRHIWPVSTSTLLPK